MSLWVFQHLVCTLVMCVKEWAGELRYDEVSQCQVVLADFLNTQCWQEHLGGHSCVPLL